MACPRTRHALRGRFSMQTIDIYSTGRNTLMVEKYGDVILRGAVLDKSMDFQKDLSVFEGGKVMGALLLSPKDAFDLINKSKYYATWKDGSIHRTSIDALEDDWFCDYASIER